MSTHYKNQPSYPIAQSPRHAAELLKGNKVKAAIVFSDQYKPATNEMQDLETRIVSKWWTSTDQPKREFISPGEATYVVDENACEELKRQGQQPQILDPASIAAELKAADLHMPPEALNALYQNMRNAIDDFSDIFQLHMKLNRDDFVMRVWQVFAPKGALGRTPALHIDHSTLSGMWYPYADRAPAHVFMGDVPQDVWNALQPSKKGKTRGKASKQDLKNAVTLRQFTKNAAAKDFMTLPSGALIIAKNLKNAGNPPSYRNLSDKKVQQSICLHKSGDVSAMGQVGLIMIPQIIQKS